MPVVVAPLADDGAEVILVESPVGTPLDQAIHEVPESQRPQVLVEWATSFTELLRKVHDRGVTHCDLKPSNLMIADEKPVILDFGASFFAQDHSMSNQLMTPVYATEGILYYRSPPSKGSDFVALMYTFFALEIGEDKWLGQFEHDLDNRPTFEHLASKQSSVFANILRETGLSASQLDKWYTYGAIGRSAKSDFAKSLVANANGSTPGALCQQPIAEPNKGSPANLLTWPCLFGLVSATAVAAMFKYFDFKRG